MKLKHLGGLIALAILLQGASAPSGMELIPKGRYTPLYTVGEKQVEVNAFYLDRYPVSNQDFKSFLKSRPKWWRSRVKSLFAEKDYLKDWSSDLSFNAEIAQSPVTYVSWFVAKAYCQAQGKHLPSGDQWEYVALASDKKAFGAREPKYRQQILDWYGKPTPNTLPAVQQSHKNYYGIYGMHGLVWEWVRDFNTVLVTGESREDSGLDRKLFCAGGAAGSTDPSDYAAYMRYAYRSSLKANYTVKNLGFRCAQEVKE